MGVLYVHVRLSFAQLINSILVPVTAAIQLLLLLPILFYPVPSLCMS